MTENKRDYLYPPKRRPPMPSDQPRELFVLRIIVSVVIATCVGGIAVALIWLFEPWAIGIGVGAATLTHLVRAARHDYDARRVREAFYVERLSGGPR